MNKNIYRVLIDEQGDLQRADLTTAEIVEIIADKSTMHTIIINHDNSDYYLSKMGEYDFSLEIIPDGSECKTKIE